MAGGEENVEGEKDEEITGERWDDEEEAQPPKRGPRKIRQVDKNFQDVFGKSTLLILHKLMAAGHFAKLNGEFNSGKEGNIYAGEDSNGRLVAVKIYRIDTSDFKNMLPYIKGDERFENIGKSKRDIVLAWTKKEYSNLVKLEDAGVSVPHPIAFMENVLVFELVTDGDSISPQLKKVGSGLKDPAGFFKKVVENMRRIHKAGLVHSDLSEYNILVKGRKPVIIDCAQAVLLTHPSAMEFLARDCENVAGYFSRKLRVKAAPDDVLKRVTDGAEEKK